MRRRPLPGAAPPAGGQPGMTMQLAIRSCPLTNLSRTHLSSWGRNPQSRLMTWRSSLCEEGAPSVMCASLGLNTFVQSHTEFTVQYSVVGTSVPRDLRCLASCACSYHVVGMGCECRVSRHSRKQSNTVVPTPNRAIKNYATPPPHLRPAPDTLSTKLSTASQVALVDSQGSTLRPASLRTCAFCIACS